MIANSKAPRTPRIPGFITPKSVIDEVRDIATQGDPYALRRARTDLNALNRVGHAMLVEERAAVIDDLLLMRGLGVRTKRNTGAPMYSLKHAKRLVDRLVDRGWLVRQATTLIVRSWHAAGNPSQEEVTELHNGRRAANAAKVRNWRSRTKCPVEAPADVELPRVCEPVTAYISTLCEAPAAAVVQAPVPAVSPPPAAPASAATLRMAALGDFPSGPVSASELHNLATNEIGSLSAWEAGEKSPAVPLSKAVPGDVAHKCAEEGGKIDYDAWTQRIDAKQRAVQGGCIPASDVQPVIRELAPLVPPPRVFAPVAMAAMGSELPVVRREPSASGPALPPPGPRLNMRTLKHLLPKHWGAEARLLYPWAVSEAIVTRAVETTQAAVDKRRTWTPAAYLYGTMRKMALGEPPPQRRAVG